MFFTEELLIVVVLYKEKLKNARPFKDIIGDGISSNCAWYVYDNSLVPDNDASTYSFVKYIHDSSNPGVSKAYNQAAAYAKSLGKKWMLLFDQDTRLPLNMLSEVEYNIGKLPLSELYTMKLFKGNSLISPCGYKFKRGYSLSNINIGKNNLKNINFLNSGLIVSIDLFEKVGGYDEKVPLYFSDFVFINKVRKHIDTYTLLPINLIHNMASNDLSDLDAFKVRFELYLKGVRAAILSEKNGGLFYYVIALLRAMKLTFYLKNRFYLIMYWRLLLK